jgi:Phage terminase large subunit
VWTPQEGPQNALVDCPLAEIFFGGARYGGKTDGVLGKWALKESIYGPHFNAIMFRRTTVSSEDAIERSKEIYTPLGGKLRDLRWRMPNGGRVAFAYLDNDKDAMAYQGRNVTDVWVEEAGQYKTPDAIFKLFGVLRSAHGVPVQMILTANPGGPGQHWIRGRYELHPFPKRPRILLKPLPDKTFHQVAVIPSRIGDNKIGLKADPGYVSRLYLVGSAQLVKAWLDGDWTAIEGAFFDCWSQRNIIAPFAVPKTWVRFRSGDWGSASPFSIGWWAVVQDDFRPGSGTADAAAISRMGIERGGRRALLDTDNRRGILPRGALIRYREWYGSTDPASGGKGLKLTAEQVGEGIASREKDDPKLSYGVFDPSAFNVDPSVYVGAKGPSFAERINGRLIAKKLAAFRAADNTRVPTTYSKDKRGPMSGWDGMRSRIIGLLDKDAQPTGIPMIYCFDTCTASIRTIPLLQHDPARAEDLDTESEDHAADDWRYACSSRPWLRAPVKKEEPKDGYRPPDEPLTHDVQSSVKLL